MVSFPSGSGGGRAASHPLSSLLVLCPHPTSLPSSRFQMSPRGPGAANTEGHAGASPREGGRHGDCALHLPRPPSGPSSRLPADPATQAGRPRGSSRGPGHRDTPGPGSEAGRGRAHGRGCRQGAGSGAPRSHSPGQGPGLRGRLCRQRPLVDGAAAAAARSQGSQPRLPAPQGAGVSWTLGGRTARPGPGPARDSSAAATVRPERGCSGSCLHSEVSGHITHTCPLIFLTCPASYGAEAEALLALATWDLGQDGPELAPCYLSDLSLLPVFPGLTFAPATGPLAPGTSQAGYHLKAMTGVVTCAWKVNTPDAQGYSLPLSSPF